MKNIKWLGLILLIVMLVSACGGATPTAETPEEPVATEEGGEVAVSIYNLTGQLVKTVLNGTVEAGVRTVTWDGTDNNGQTVTSGVYLYKLTAGETTDTKKMVLVK